MAIAYEPTFWAGLAQGGGLRLIRGEAGEPGWFTRLSTKRRQQFVERSGELDGALLALRRQPGSAEVRAEAKQKCRRFNGEILRIFGDLSPTEQEVMRKDGEDTLLNKALPFDLSTQVHDEAPARPSGRALPPVLKAAIELVSRPLCNAKLGLFYRAVGVVPTLEEGLRRDVFQAIDAYEECSALVLALSLTPHDPASDDLLIEVIQDTFQVFRSHRRRALETALKDLLDATKLLWSTAATLTIFSREGLPWLLRLLREGEQIAAFSRLWRQPGGQPYWLHHVGSSAVDAVLDAVELPGSSPAFDHDAWMFLDEHPDDLSAAAVTRLSSLRLRVHPNKPQQREAIERQGEIDEIFSFSRRRQQVIGLVHGAVGAVVNEGVSPPDEATRG